METLTLEELTAELLSLLEEKKYGKVKTLLSEVNPADIALLFEEIEQKDVPKLYRLLNKELAALTFSYMDTDRQKALITSFSDKELKEVIDELYLDDTVDMIEEMPANVVDRILRNIDPQTRKTINELLNYPEDSAGSIMTTEYVSLRKDMTVQEAFAHIRAVGLDKETIYTCYVTENRKLLGLVTVKALLMASYEDIVGDIMDTNVICVETHEDQELVANMFNKYDFLALPVVDAEYRIVGIITVDDAMQVIVEESEEDMEAMAAILPSDKPYIKTGVFETWTKRIPWLLLLMLSATFTSKIIQSYEEALGAYVILTAFIPMLMGTGGNAGSQSSVSIIRSISMNEIEFGDIFSVVWKELRVSILCAICLGLGAFLKAITLDGTSAIVGLVVAITLAVTIVVAKFVGAVLPLVAKKLGFDPAVMVNPFITTIVDALSLIIYFTIASAMLGI